MNYKEINDKWKVFLTENAFKEDIVIKPEKKKRKKKKEIIFSEKDDVNEWEEFDEVEMADGPGAGYNDATDSVEEEKLEEFSGAGAAAGFSLPLGAKRH